MKWLTFEVQRSPGFRFNLTDLTLIVLLVSMAAWLRQALPDSSLFALPVYIGATFFLFCNVFRIGNRLEAWWYLPFIATAALCVHRMELELLWWLVLLVFEPLKWSLIAYRILRGPYYGIFARSESTAPSTKSDSLVEL